MKEYSLYKGMYCGICRSMGKCTGCLSPLTLNYDYVFLALVRTAIAGEKLVIKKIWCPLHPFRLRHALYPQQTSGYVLSALQVSAYSSAILGYRKLKDDIRDRRGLERLLSYIILPIYSISRCKALKNRPEYISLDNNVAELLDELNELENSNAKPIDKPADVFGKLLATVFSFGFEGISARITDEIGFHIGRFIYIADALDDLDEDIHSGSYNPLIGESFSKLTAMSALMCELDMTRKAIELIESDETGYIAIIRNMLDYGLPATAEKIAGKAESAINGGSEPT